MAGNANSGKRKDKLFHDALVLELKSREDDDKRGIRAIARKLVDIALEGEMQAIKEVADRLDGKPAQAIVGGDEDDNPLRHVHKIERLIVDLANSDGEGVQPSTEAEPV
jgi:hypothetical protein